MTIVLYTSPKLPLQLSFATSIHKSKGLTLESQVVDMEGIFAEGHQYTGSWRFTDLSSLQIILLILQLEPFMEKLKVRWFMRQI